MANLCSLSDKALSELKTSLRKIITKDNEEIENQLVDRLRRLPTQYKSITDEVDTIYNSVREIFSEVFGEVPDYVNPQNISRLINNTKETTEVLTNSEDINNSEEVETIRQSRNYFLRKAYQSNRSLLTYIKNSINEDLFNVLFLDRNDNLGLQTKINSKNGYKNVSSNNLLNRRIKDYKNILYQRIVKYFEEKELNLENLPKELYKNSGKRSYTGALQNDDFNAYAITCLKGNKVFEEVELLFEKGEYDNSLFQAYNALVILNNFDEYVLLVLPKGIMITSSYGKETTENKYMISDNTSQLRNSFRTTDDINVAEETNSITKLGIETTHIISWKNGNRVGNKYLSFNDWSYIVANVKQLYFNKACSKEFDIRLRTIGQLSKDTINVLNTYGFKNLKEIIAFLPSNPTELFPAVFDILCSKKYYESNRELYSGFNSDLLNKLRSINEGIFNGEKSLRLLQDPNATSNYYNFCTQSAISVNTNNIMLYFLDYDGTIKPRLMINNIIFSTYNDLVARVNSVNDKQIIDWGAERSQLNLHIIENPNNQNSDKIEFIIPGSNIDVLVNIRGEVTIKSENGEISINSELGDNTNAVRNFIDKTLGLNLEANSEFESLLNERYGNHALFTLLKTASRTIYCKYLSNDKLKQGISINRLLEELPPIRSGTVYESFQGDIDLVHPLDRGTVYQIATTKVILDGRTTSSVVLDSKGNANSNYTFNRLFETYFSLWELLCKLQTCPASHFMLMNTDNLIHGIYNMKEFYSTSTGTKNTTRMNVNELVTANFVHDFVGGLMSHEDVKGDVLASDGKVLFITSVNADKNLVGKILVDLNLVPKISDPIFFAKHPELENKKLRDYNREELITLINHEFYSYYDTMIINVKSTFNQLSDFIGGDIGESLRHGLQDNFESFNSMDLGGLTPVQYLDDVVRRYRLKTKTNIELTDLTHFISLSNGKILANEVMLGLLKRYGSIEEANNFWIGKEKEIVKLLLNEDFKLSLTNTDQKELLKIKNDYSSLKSKSGTSWMNSSGNMILCKIKVKGLIIDISSLRDIEKVLGNNWEDYINNVESFELHPLLSTYNLLDHLITLEFLDSTVGSYTNHSGKGESFSERESSMQDALNKRNNSLTSPVSQWTLNTLNGISDEYKIAVIREAIDIGQGNSNGIISDVNAMDGGTFVDPFTVKLENISSGGNKEGTTGKPYIHGYNARTGNGIAIKTATFGLDNNKIRNGKEFQIMMKKMTDHQWLDMNGNPIDLNVSISKVNSYNLNYFEEDGIYYQITSNRKEGNRYINTVQRVDENGNTLIHENGEFYEEEERIYENVNSNYKLWKMFGGERSMSIVNGKLEYSDVSIDNVVKAMNTIYILIDENNLNSLRGKYLPLKHSNINYLCTLGAVKQGAANINPSERFYDDVSYNYQTVKLYNAGILLDKEHELNNDDIANSTLATNSSAYRGYTFEQALNLYDSLGRLSNLNTEKHLKAIKNLLGFPDDDTFTKEFREILYDTIIDNFSKDSNNVNNFALSLAEGLIKRANSTINGFTDYSSLDLPIGDSMIYHKVITSINSYFTQKGIKAKIPGVLAILNPSFDLMKIYDNKKYGKFREEKVVFDENIRIDLKEGKLYSIIYHDSNKEEITSDINKINDLIEDGVISKVIDITNTLKEAQIKYDENPVYDVNDKNTSISNIKLNRTYKIYKKDPITGNDYIETLLVKVPEYLKLKEDLNKNEITKIVEDVTVGRNLSSYNALFDGIIKVGETEVKRRFNLYDLDSVLAIYKIEEIRNIKNYNDKDNALDNFINSNIDLRKAYNEYYKVPRDLQELKSNIDIFTKLYEADLDDVNKKEQNKKELRKFLTSYSYSEFLRSKVDSKLNSFMSPREIYNVIRTEAYDQYFNHKFDFVYKFVHRWKQFDFNNLSINDLSLAKTYNNLIRQKEGLTGDELKNWYTKYNCCIDIMFGFPRDSKREKVNDSNFEELDKIYRNWVNGTNTVKIDGKNYRVNKESIQKEAFECIMPKRYAEVFDLNENIDLQEIINDKEFFVKKLISNMGTKVDSNNYTLEFKVSSGKHYYVISKSQLNKADLTQVTPFITEDDGVRWRCDQNGNKLYKIGKNDTVYLDKFGNEIIATTLYKNETWDKGFGFYINSLHYNSIKISKILANEDNICKSLINLMLKSTNRTAKKLGKAYSNQKSSLDVIKYSENINSKVNINNIDKSSELYRKGLEMHSSFLRTLDIIAARTPGQSMQSFMAMKVIEFDDSGKNNTYVSSMLNLLQGSDYDIDTVSLFTFDVNRNGILLLWSPYANLTSIELLKASEKLPLPTGNLIGYENGKNYIDIFRKYMDIISINKINDELYVDFTADTEKYINHLADLLRSTNVLIKPTTDNEYNDFIKEINDSYRAKNGIDYDILSDKSDVDNIYTLLIELINNHNTYLDGLSKYDKNIAYHNYMISNQIDIISDVANLSQSLQPTDYITLPLKDVADNTPIAKKIKSVGVGNVIGKIKAYTLALVGKEDVGITAVGSKIFSGLTFYYNYILRHGTPEQRRNLLRYKTEKGKRVIDYRSMLANIYTTDISNIDDLDLLDALRNVDNTYDYALNIAALISLAADNAKDPKLGKLNATTKTIGMYIYGTMQGIPFAELARLITSRTGLLYSKLLSSNVFSNDFGYNGAHEIREYFTYEIDLRFFNKYNIRLDFQKWTSLEIFKYFFDREFKGLINEEEVFRNEDGEVITNAEEIKSKLLKSSIGRKIYLFASRHLDPSKEKQYINPADLNNYRKKDYVTIEDPSAGGAITYCKAETVKDKLEILENIRNKYKHDSNLTKAGGPDSTSLFNQLIDFVEDYVINMDKIDRNELWKLIHLADGAEESRILGLEYGTNQRIQTNLNDFLNLIDNFELSVYNRKKKMKLNPTENDIMDLVKFALDPEYKKEWIKKYEEVKHTDNILDAVSHSPNYIAYIESLACALRENMESFKFRSTKTLLKDLLVKNNLTNKKNLIYGIERFVNNYVRNEWLLLSLRYITLPANSRVFVDREIEINDKNPVIIRTLGKSQILLGTDKGNANFKLFMELVVIPDLKKLYPLNNFIQKLTPVITNRTVSKNNITVYSLDINMSPRNTIDQLILDSYKTEFRKLTGSDNIYEIKDIDGSTILKIPISDLFIYYTMIAHNWELSEKSLLPVMQDILTTNNLINDYLKFETIFDRSDMTLHLGDDLDSDAIWDELRYYIGKSGWIGDNSQGVVWVRNPETGMREPTYKAPKLTEEEILLLDEFDIYLGNRVIGESTRPYSFYLLGRDVLHFGKVEETILEFDNEIPINYNISFNYDRGSIKTLKDGRTVYDIKDVSVNGQFLQIKEIEFVKENGLFKPKFEDIVNEYKKQSCEI